MPTFAEWEAMRRGQGVPSNAATVQPEPEQGQRHATLGDDYMSAAEGELLRTGAEAVKGLARSPWDALKGLVGLPGQAWKGLTQDLPQLAADPSLITELPQSIAHGIKDLGNNPREAGSLLGQLLLAPKVPGAANTALAEGPSLAGRAVSAVGRGAEAVGTSKALKRATPFGAMGTAINHPGMAALELAVPPALEYGGRGLQKLGGAMEGLDLSYKGRRPFSPTEAVPEPAETPEAETVRETVRTAREAKAGGASTAQANQRAGWPLGKSSETPYRAGSGADVAGARGAEQAQANSLVRELAKLSEGDTKWAGDASAKSPIDQFYESDPQAKRGGEGRMTGQFEEGEGGLSSLGGPSPEGPLSPLDELSRLSGRAPSTTRMQELLKKFGEAGA